jgi:hypothetical protein
MNANTTIRRASAARVGLAGLLALSAWLCGGCLGAPKLEDRWTRIDLPAANVTPYQTMPLGAPESLRVQAQITYRSIVTGYAVAELRVSPTITGGSVTITPTAPREAMAASIDSLLQHSTSIGRATRAITGWDHLIQHIDFAFSAAVPGVLDSTGASAGGLFMVCYLGAGDKIERPGQADTIIITPFRSAEVQVLPIGMTFRTSGPVAP